MVALQRSFSEQSCLNRKSDLNGKESKSLLCAAQIYKTYFLVSLYDWK